MTKIEFWEEKKNYAKIKLDEAQRAFNIAVAYYENAIKNIETNRMSKIYYDWRAMQPRGSKHE